MINDGTSITSTLTGHCHNWFYRMMWDTEGNSMTEALCIDCGHKESRVTKCPR